MLFGALLLVAGVSLAQQKPPMPTPPKPPNPFPMSSQNFRKFFDKIMANADSAAQMPSGAAGDSPPPMPSGWQERARFLASQAMEDGWVTKPEFQQIVAVMRGR